MVVRVGVVGFKGGTGRTHVAFQMAERATHAGHKVKLWDLHPLKSALLYADIRGRTDLPLWETQSRDMELTPGTEDIGSIDDVDLLICDFPQYRTEAAIQWMDWLDLLLVPVSPSPLDLIPLTEMGHLAVDRNWPFVFVPNMLPRSPSLRLELLETLGNEGFKVAPVQIGYWLGIPDSAQYGQSVCERQPKSKAAQEIDQLWQWLADRTKLESAEHPRVWQ